jgi:DNA-binding MarR family transcriptional regulator
VIDWAADALDAGTAVAAGGISLGGEAAVTVAGIDPRVTRVAAIGASPDWTSPGMHRFDDPGKLMAQGEPDLYARWLYDNLDPVTHLDRYARGPAMAFECGQDDVHVPADGALRFRNALAAAHPDAAGRVRVTVHPGIGHLDGVRSPAAAPPVPGMVHHPHIRIRLTTFNAGVAGGNGPPSRPSRWHRAALRGCRTRAAPAASSTTQSPVPARRARRCSCRVRLLRRLLTAALPGLSSSDLTLSHMTQHDDCMDDHEANLLGALAIGVRDLVREALAEAAGLDETAVAALLVVRARPGQSITDLATAVGLTHPGAVRAVNRLEQRGLVARAHGRDGRSRGLALTAAGEAVSARGLAARRDSLHRLLEGVPREHRASLISAAEAMLARLPASRGDAWRICRTCDHGVCRGSQCPVGSAIDRRRAG